ncbi:hypothetical protein GOPIP_038_00040 [Gordonia polyisoprenivorans NBRC 16320 = JCM 10675]|nr:hypothetical protein GOPIP_038_00040 [Gordonia polyisoprenivorans NBRC 16320 = JCM 10675]
MNMATDQEPIRITSSRGPKRLTCVREAGTCTVEIESDEPFELKVSVRQIVRQARADT